MPGVFDCWARVVDRIAPSQISFYLQQYSQMPYSYNTANYASTAACTAACGGTGNLCYNNVLCYYGAATAATTASTTLLGNDAFCSASSTTMFSTLTTSTTGTTTTGKYCWCPSSCTGTLSYDYIADSPIAGAPTYVQDWPCARRGGCIDTRPSRTRASRRALALTPMCVCYHVSGLRYVHAG